MKNQYQFSAMGKNWSSIILVESFLCSQYHPGGTPGSASAPDNVYRLSRISDRRAAKEFRPLEGKEDGVAYILDLTDSEM